MSTPDPQDNTHNISKLLIMVVILAIVIISTLTITAILAGPPL